MIAQANAPTVEKTEKPAPASWAIPRTNIREEKDQFVLQLEMPGVRKDGLEVTVEENELTILGHRTETPLPGELIYRESRPVNYRRVFDLDPAIDTGKIQARIDHGILTLTLPKAESVKPRKITVTD